MPIACDFNDATRLLFWRRPLAPDPRLTAAAGLGLVAFLYAIDLVAEYWLAGEGWSFQLYGLGMSLGWYAVAVALMIRFARIDSTTASLRNLLLLFAASSILATAAAMAARGIAQSGPRASPPKSRWS